MKDVDVAYILNLVNFHSVDFTGRASGKAIVKSIFNDPDVTSCRTQRYLTCQSTACKYRRLQTTLLGEYVYMHNSVYENAGFTIVGDK